ncbi:MAG: hypothetical protein BWX84_00071 [Verrucomicrobia bacterium ADurb.Bin118]|nr:MAG: hypothetical protein BWX84_00071 [Verrucomicrobia bacterium ADurb.Bin118]
MEQSSSMWVDEAIWGHRLYDEQLPWFVFLEFLNVFTHEDDKGRAFDEQGKPNELKYRAAHRLYLRNILFNNPHLPEIRLSYPNDTNRWDEWSRRMKSAATGLNHPEFGFLKDHFHSFEDFCEVVSLVRSTSLEVNSNKRWTSKFVFPYGRGCLYEDLDNSASTNDRRFFGRTGEMLYLMLCRTPRKQELLAALKERLAKTDSTWDSIVRCLQPTADEDISSERANAFLPYLSHPCFDDLADDWLALLRLKIPGFDVYPHLVNLAGLHMVKYQLTVSRQLLGAATPLALICEVVAPKKTLVREVSCDLYQSNNLLPAQAVETFIANVEKSEEWQRAITESGAFEKCRRILKQRVRWGEDYDGPSDAGELISRLRQDAMKRHRQHVANIHRNYGREIGLVSRRGTVKLRYAPTDSLLKTLLFANVEKRIELHQFLARLHTRYGLVFGDKEAEQVLSKDEFDKKAFQGNSRRLEQRLGSLGLLRRLSDGCAYVVNPYHTEVQ